MAFKRKPPPGNARRVRSQASHICGITTNKRGRLVQFESEQERKLILLLERDATVTDYVSQPETLHYCDSHGRQRTYTPDFQVWRIDGQIELHEVTLEARRQAFAPLPPREIAAQAICQQRGWSYHVHTEQDLPSGGEYANLNSLSPFRAKIYHSPPVTAWWLQQLTGREPIHPQFLLPQTAVGELLNGLYHLLWHNQIAMDWRHPLFQDGYFSPTASIWLPPTIASASSVHEPLEPTQGGPR
jgi:hypothetical protein